MNPQANPPIVLIIAGNDPSGGAGLAADIQAVSALGAHPAPVVAALTVQDTRNAYAVQALDAAFVAAQARAVLDDLPVAAIKLGLLGSAAIGRAVTELLADFSAIPVVCDPVLVAAGGAQLAEDELLTVYQQALLPRTSLLTPNALESRRLAPAASTAAARAAHLLRAGAQYVLLKGGDEATPQVQNTLYGPDDFQEMLDWERLPGQHHGSGCTLASACAALLARGYTVPDAVREAQHYTWHALQNGWRPGRDSQHSQNIPDRQWQTRNT